MSTREKAVQADPGLREELHRQFRARTLPQIRALLEAGAEVALLPPVSGG